MTDDASVAAAVEAVGALDVLVNNAGISGGMVPACPRSRPAMLEDVFATNVVGLVRVTQAFVPLLRALAEPRDRQRLQRDGLADVTTDPQRLESTTSTGSSTRPPRRR